VGPLAQATATDFTTIAEFLQKLTLTAALVFIIWGGYRRWWVWGHQLAECDARWLKRDEEWKERLDKLDATWERRYASREAELKGDIVKWEAEHRRTSDLLDRSLLLQEQRLRDQEQERKQRGTP